VTVRVFDSKQTLLGIATINGPATPELDTPAAPAEAQPDVS
jgi:hypothetical protein